MKPTSQKNIPVKHSPHAESTAIQRLGRIPPGYRVGPAAAAFIMGLVDMVLSYGFVLATALGAARRCKMVTCHPAALQNQHARLAFEKFIWVGDIVAERGGAILAAARNQIK